MTLYALKPRFQALLRPLAAKLVRVGVTANQVTLAAAGGSLLLGALVAANGDTGLWFLLIPIWLLLRMGLNALDGMLAREHGQESTLGAYLNEIGDLVSDAALYLPFAFLAVFHPLWVAAVVFLALLSEFAGVLGPMVGATRRYDGPLGKSDRALVFGILGLAAGLVPELPAWVAWVMPVLALLLAITIVNRVRGALRDLRALPPRPSA